MAHSLKLNRRHFMMTTAATSLMLGAGRAAAAEPLKTAGVYTVPVEQQWVSRLHKRRARWQRNILMWLS